MYKILKEGIRINIILLDDMWVSSDPTRIKYLTWPVSDDVYY